MILNFFSTCWTTPGRRFMSRQHGLSDPNTLAKLTWNLVMSQGVYEEEPVLIPIAETHQRNLLFLDMKQSTDHPCLSSVNA